jgi:hypothetical protein
MERTNILSGEGVYSSFGLRYKPLKNERNHKLKKKIQPLKNIYINLEQSQRKFGNEDIEKGDQLIENNEKKQKEFLEDTHFPSMKNLSLKRTRISKKGPKKSQ